MENSIKNESCQKCRSVGNWEIEQTIEEGSTTIYQVHCKKCFTKTSIYISSNRPLYHGIFNW